MYWITSSNRKRHQRALNTAIQKINTSITNDELWQGRFYVRQSNYSQWIGYEDKSGYELYVILEFIDRTTGQVWEQGGNVNHFLFGSRLFWLMNEFITEHTKVWETDPRPGTANWYKDLKEQKKHWKSL